MADAYSPAEMRKELDKALAAIREVELKVWPLRQEYDKLSQQNTAKLKQLSDQFKKLEEPLGPLKKKVALLSRALAGGR